MRARRVAATLMAVAALATGAAACGDDGDSGDAGTPPATTTAAPTTAAPATTAASSTTERTGIDDPAAGKVVFTQNCSGCHTLADAGATGAVGPNLDDLKPDYSIVGSQVAYGGGGMPSFEGKLTSQQIGDVAAYVSSVAGG